MVRWFGAAVMAAGVALGQSVSTPARAEVTEITVAQQFGVAFLPLLLMEREQYAESQAKAAGLGDFKVNWVKLAGPSNINDGLISNTVQFAATGAPSLITLWAKTNGQIKAMSALTTYPLYLNTRNPDVKSIKDLSEKDKIAIPSVKISTQAIVLQMAAADLYGEANWAKFDPLTVSLAHPDGMIALMNNTSGVNAHFATSPFHEQEMKIPGVRTIATSYDILGGRASALVITANAKFRDANPKVFKAFFDAVKQSIDTINKDKAAAAKAYLEISGDKKNSVDDIVAMIGHPDYAFTLVPEKVFKTALFMNKIGSVKVRPDRWQDLFFPEAHDLKGD